MHTVKLKAETELPALNLGTDLSLSGKLELVYTISHGCCPGRAGNYNMSEEMINMWFIHYINLNDTHVISKTSPFRFF